MSLFLSNFKLNKLYLLRKSTSRIAQSLQKKSIKNAECDGYIGYEENALQKIKNAEIEIRAAAALFSCPNKASAANCCRLCFHFQLQVQSYVTLTSSPNALKFIIFSLCDQIKTRARIRVHFRRRFRR